MTLDLLREWLYFPLGFLPSLFFGSRWLVQWIQSEKRKSCYVGPGFWKLSLFGNILLTLHYCLQLQYHFALVQAINAVISWRNLNFLQSASPFTVKQTALITLMVVFSVTMLFFVQHYFFIDNTTWFRSIGGSNTYPSVGWHLIGVGGIILFASRFWVQWWQLENKQQSELSTLFWLLSIFGSVLISLYSIRIMDIVSLFHNAWAIIPCLRNLHFIKLSTPATQVAWK